jgi:hypothetical protein
MKTLLYSRDHSSKGAALIIVLAFVVLVTGLAVAYLSRTTTDRQLAQSSFNDTSADLLARSALDIVVSDLKQEVLNDPTTATSANIQPARYGTPLPSETPIPNLIRRSFSGDPTGRTSSVSSGAVSANGRSISTARWNSHYLVPRGNTGITTDSSPVPSFTAPDWVLVTAQGPTPAPAPNAVIGRYAFAVYDEGGLLDMTLAGYATGSGAGGGPSPSPTPWLTNVGRKGIVAFADLTALPAAPTTTLPQTQINNIVGWRNFANTQQPGTFGSASFLGNLNRQDAYGSYLLDFGDPPYPTPCPIFPFTNVDTTIFNGRTDQAIMTRQELLKLRSSLNFSQNALQYMGTFSRERNQPARDWSSLNNKITDRFDIGMLSLVKPNPTGTPPSRGKGKGKGRGRFKGDAASILNLFGLQWVPASAAVTDPHKVAYWNHWKYVGSPGLPPNPNPHVPALRGGRNDFFQLLDYAMTQANANSVDTLNAQDIMSLGASLIDQNDAPPDDADVGPTHPTPTHVTIIETGDSGQFVLGWENGEALPAADTNPLAPKNPYNWINDPPGTSSLKPTPTPGATPIVLNHVFSTVSDFGYGLRPELATNRFKRLDFHTANPNANLLDFFTYNPVDHNYPRVGLVNLNTKNVPVIAAILQSALKKDIDAAPPPNSTVPPTEATPAAQLIVNATTAQPALTRADIGRLTAAAASAISTAGFAAGEEQEKVPEAIARALCEVTQTRTWNLMIDVIAQTGRYAPGTPDLTDPTKFTVEGEKRYWLHIALGRDLVSGSVDVLGTQLEEVTE